MTLRIGMVDETIGCVCPRWSTDDEVDHRLRQVIYVLKEQGLSVREWFWMKRLYTLERCKNILTANHANEPFRKNIPRPLHHFI